MKRTWLADLVQLPPGERATLAAVLDFNAPEAPEEATAPVRPATGAVAAPVDVRVGGVAQVVENLTCWQPTEIRFAEPQAPALEKLSAEDRARIRGEKTPPPPWTPWRRWSQWEPKLGALLSQPGPGFRIDERRLVAQHAQRRPCKTIPRRDQPLWPQGLQIWIDAAPELATLAVDYRDIAEKLSERLGPMVEIEEVDFGPCPRPQGPVLWLGHGPRAAALRHATWVVTPHTQTWDRPGLKYWSWGRPSPQFLAQLEQLLVVASVAVRLSAGLVRDLRRLVAPDAGLEPAFLARPEIKIGVDGIAWSLGKAEPWRGRFSGLPAALQAQVYQVLRRHHDGPEPTEVWWEEQALLRLLAPHTVPAGEEIETYAESCRRFYREGEHPSLTAQWLQESSLRLGPRQMQMPAAYRQTVYQAQKDRGLSRMTGLDPELFPPTDQPEKMYRLEQQGTRLVLVPKEAPVLGSPIVELPAAAQVQFVGPDGQGLRCPLPNAQVEWPPIRGVGYVVTDRARVTLEAATQPPWASGIGRDQHGLFAEVTLQGVDFRMRWVPPGRFLMGSPEDEVGRWGSDPEDDIETWPHFEGPQHEVTHPQGFWLGATSVTQKLWQAVMGYNPSEFQKATHPVEQVSWEDVQKFLAEAEKIAEGIGLDLPTEAQWEYACRAGTTTATYAGDLEILGEHHAPLLDTIGWYGGNCGVDFELKNGWDTRDWKEKQYKFSKGGTHPVGLKLANPWGLYDMLGNVWEWCADGLRKYESGPLTSPVGPEGPSDRVLRGGSWYDLPRVLRAAGRYVFWPGFAFGDLGFRLFRGHLPAPSPAHPKAQEPNRGPQPARGAGEPEAQARGTVGAWGAQQGATKTPPEPSHSPEVALAPGTGDSEPVAP